MNVFTRTILLFCLLALLPTVATRSLQDGSHNCFQDGTTLDCRHRNLTTVPKIPADVTAVLLDNNNIDTIDNGAFAGASQLKVLSLSYNNISRLPVDAFRGLSLIWRLHLGHNHLCLGDDAYPSGVFRPLKSLQTLNIASNNCEKKVLQKYPEEAFKDLVALKELAITALDAQRNPLGQGFEKMRNLETLMFIGVGSAMGNIPCEYFAPIRETRLRKLSLRYASVYSMCKTVFQHLKYLSYLNIACNRYLQFQNLNETLANMAQPTLQTLSIDMIGYGGGEVGTFRYVDFDYASLKNVRRISMRQTGEIVINTSTMKTLANAELIVFSHSMVFFDPSEANVPDIVTVLLNNSKLITLGLPYFKDPKYSIESLEKEMCRPDRIDLEDRLYFPMHDPYTPKSYGSENQETGFWKVLPQNSQLNNTEIPNQFSMTSEQRQLLHQHSYSFDLFEKLLFTKLPRTVRSVYFDNCQPNVINGLLKYNINHLNNVKYLNLSTMSSIPTSDLFQQLKKFPNLAIVEAKLCQISSIENIFPFLGNLTTINFNNNTISDLTNPFKNFPNLESIFLEYNKISTIDANVVSGLPKLKSLYLAHNTISSTYLNLSSTPLLKYVNLEGNNIPYLSKEFLEDIEKHPDLVLNIQNNTFACECSAVPFIEWLQKTLIDVTNKGSLTCQYKDDPAALILQINVTFLKLSCYKWLLPVSIALSTAIVIGVAMIVAYRKRWALCLAYYLMKRRLRIYLKRLRSNSSLFSYKDLDESSGSYAYEAFVAHDNADYDWVTHDFYEKVEVEWGIKLCVARRDCMPGEPVPKTIVDAIDASRLVICLLTPGFAESEWCDFELKMSLDRGLNTVIFILKEEIPWDRSTKLLQRIVYGRRGNDNFLDYPEDAQDREAFWKLLRDKLRRD